MVGKAGAMMVCSSAERNPASRMPQTMERIAAWSSGAGAVGSEAAMVGAPLQCAETRSMARHRERASSLGLAGSGLQAGEAKSAKADRYRSHQAGSH